MVVTDLIRPWVAAIPLVFSCALGCGGDGATEGTGTTIDTLPGGAVVVHNSDRGLWGEGEGEGWRLVEELRLGTSTAEGAESFSSILGLEVDEAGRIYVLDGQAKEVRVFDSGGGLVRTLGRPGEGPGEFQNPNGMTMGLDGGLWVQDPANSRYTVFDTAGNIVASPRRDFAGWSFMWDGRFDPSGSLLVPTVAFNETGTRTVIVRWEPDLASADTFPLPRVETAMFEFRAGNASGVMAVPFAPSLHRVIDDEGRLWIGHSDAYRIVYQTVDGDTLRIVEREYTPVDVTEEEQEAALREALDRFPFELRESDVELDRDRIPDVRPAYELLLVDPDGVLWVGRTGSDGEMVLDVFDPDGRYLGEVRPPVEMEPRRPWRFQGDRLHVVTTDELDVPYVVRLRIER